MKRLFTFLLAAAALVALTSGVALANFGPHGGYAADTDQCAACHRAHTSFSSATWKDYKGNNHSALLVSDASSISQFCNACHGNGAPGASTNVVAGVFEGSSAAQGPSTAGGASVGTNQKYVTMSTDLGKLNGGGFATAGTTSMHNMDNGDGITDPMWGYGSALPGKVNLTCTDCHDPHGSSNYRLLKDSINQVTVGGYDASETPAPFVVSNEMGYPQGGWLKHDAGSLQMASYKPDYTSEQIAHQDTGLINGNAQQRSMSAWCSACHTQYGQRTSTYDYAGTAAPAAGGATTYHRHPVDISLAAGVGSTKALAVDVETTSTLPLEYAWNNLPAQGTKTAWTTQDYLGCLTCHYAHGTTATMTAGSWATARTTGTGTTVSQVPTSLPSPTVGTTVQGVPVLDNSRTGTNPNNSSSLLRLDNRGVCEGCHNK